MKNPDIGNWKSAFTFSLGWTQRIILFTAFKLGGLTPGYFRFFNILLHLGSTFLVFTILSILTKKNVAIFASIIFAVHPILVESITWISGMPYPLYSFFLLFSFLMYILSKKTKKYYYISLALFILAILSNATRAIVFFLILIVYELSFGSLKNSWKRLTPYVLLNSLLLISSVSQVGSRISSVEAQQYQQSGGIENPFIQIPVAISSYLKLMFWPDKLTLYQTELNFSMGQFVLCVLVILIFLGLVLYGWKKNKAVFFWLSFFVIVLSPTLTPFKIAWVVAERYVYLGSVGIFVVFAMFFDWLMQKSDQKSDGRYRYLFYGVFIIMIIALSARTIIRNMDWRNEDTLWIATAKTSPSGQNSHNNLGDVYARNGNYPMAVEEFTKAVEINPNYADAYHNLANTYQMMGQEDKAIENYDKALAINPNIWQSYENLSSIYFNEGNYPEALVDIQKAISINPNDDSLKNNLASIQGKIQDSQNQ
jgi:tetratricopeptide (TPR) repeat protein